MKTKIQEVIEEAKSAGCWRAVTPESVNVYFDVKTPTGMVVCRDETQFDLWSRSKESELEDLWNEFSDENGFDRDSVCAVESVGMNRDDYEEVIGDKVCEEILNAAINLDLFFRGEGVDTDGIEDEGYDTGILPQMRDLMIKWLYMENAEEAWDVAENAD